MTTDPAPRSRVDGLLEEGRRLQALAEKAEAWKPPSGCCEAGFKLSPRGFCSECNAGPDETCRMRWGAPPAMFEAAMVKDGMSLIRSLCEALGEAQKDAERYAQVRTWTPVLFASAWEVNLKTGKPFDEIVDHLKPFRDARSSA